MSEPRKSFLEARGAKAIDPAALDSYVASMIDEVIPEILKDVRSREQLAAELRYSRTASQRDAPLTRGAKPGT